VVDLIARKNTVKNRYNELKHIYKLLTYVGLSKEPNKVGFAYL
jgi:hypothetical protein